MRKFLITIGIILLFTSSYTYQESISAQNDGIPSYAKWGKLAMKETKSKYPKAEIIDYLHVGKETKDDATIEKFKLWLKEETSEFGVFIDIEFNTETEKVIHITFEETDR